MTELEKIYNNTNGELSKNDYTIIIVENITKPIKELELLKKTIQVF